MPVCAVRDLAPARGEGSSAAEAAVAVGRAPGHGPRLPRSPGDAIASAPVAVSAAPAAVAAPTAAPAALEEVGATLCRACGLCCNGALYAYVSLSDVEAARLRTRLPVFQTARETDHDFALPCSLHGAEGCTIYEDRPNTCASYSCFLLDAVQGGRLRLPRALRAVGELRATITTLEAALPPGDSLWERAAVARSAPPPRDPRERAGHAAMLRGLDELEQRLRDEVDDRLPLAAEA